MRGFVFRSAGGVTEVITEFRLRPTQRPGRVARLRGVIPLMLHLRRPEPTLVIPLAGTAVSHSAATTPRSRSKKSTTRETERLSRCPPLNVEKADLPDHPDPREQLADLIGRIEARASTARRWFRLTSTTKLSAKLSSRSPTAAVLHSHSTTRPSPAGACAAHRPAAVLACMDRLGRTATSGTTRESTSTPWRGSPDIDDPPRRGRPSQIHFIGDYLRDRIEFVDADGRPLSVNLPFPHPTANPSGEFLVQTLVSGPTVAQLRIYRLSRLATEIPFEFNDVPSP